MYFFVAKKILTLSAWKSDEKAFLVTKYFTILCCNVTNKHTNVNQENPYVSSNVM